MPIRRFPRRGWFVTLAIVVASLGCSHSMYPNPYGPPAYSNPWATPNAAAAPPGTTLPPPMGQQNPPAAIPGSSPSLPPAAGATAPNNVPTVPGAGIQGPNWSNPGTLQQQQQRANVFDPFANNEVGPEIVGGRPRGFQKPMTEATRAQPQGFRNLRVPF